MAAANPIASFEAYRIKFINQHGESPSSEVNLIAERDTTDNFPKKLENVASRETLRPEMKLRQLVAGIALSQVGLGVTVAEFDDFDAPIGALNPTESWLEGVNSVTNPFQQPFGGPDDSGFLSDSSNGNNAGGRVQLWNTDQWTGDYLGQGILSLSMDAINLSGAGGEPLHFRVAFNGPGGWFVSDPQTVVPQTGWQSLLFDLSLTGLSYAGGGNTAYGSTMSSVNRMQIISLQEGGPFSVGGNSGLRGELVNASWGLDNIRAGVAIPEPANLMMALLGGIGLLRRRR